MSEPESPVERDEYRSTVFFLRLAFQGRDDPHPELERFETSGSRGNSTFSWLGRPWRCSWEYCGGGDRAYWDDGWWPSFETPAPKRHFHRREWVRLWGRGRIEEAVEQGLIPKPLTQEAGR